MPDICRSNNTSLFDKRATETKNCVYSLHMLSLQCFCQDILDSYLQIMLQGARYILSTKNVPAQ